MKISNTGGNEGRWHGEAIIEILGLDEFSCIISHSWRKSPLEYFAPRLANAQKIKSEI